MYLPGPLPVFINCTGDLVLALASGRAHSQAVPVGAVAVCSGQRTWQTGSVRTYLESLLHLWRPRIVSLEIQSTRIEQSRLVVSVISLVAEWNCPVCRLRP